MFVGFLLPNGSWWNLGLLSLNTALQILRILREEPLLQGYADYTQRVRWRLLPLVW